MQNHQDHDCTRTVEAFMCGDQDLKPSVIRDCYRHSGCPLLDDDFASSGLPVSILWIVLRIFDGWIKLCLKKGKEYNGFEVLRFWR